MLFSTEFCVSTKNRGILSQVHYYVQSHIQINEYRDRIILVSIQNAPSLRSLM